MELTIEIYERAQERAKDDAALKEHLLRLEMLNREQQELTRQGHEILAGARQKGEQYAKQEEIIAEYMNRVYPEDSPVHDHQEG